VYAAWRKSDLVDYRKARSERRMLYSKTDEVLYDMCRRWPGHRYKFFQQFLLYFSDLKEKELKPTVRDADWYLIWTAYEYYA